MTTQELITLLINAALIPLVAWGINELTSYLKAKANNEQLDKYFELANDAVITAVEEIMQVFVSAWKKNGTWTEEAAKDAFEMAKLKAQELMGATVLKALPEIVGDVEAWITSKIEAATRAAKITENAASSEMVEVRGIELETESEEKNE